jgi:hypothetical protein
MRPESKFSDTGKLGGPARGAITGRSCDDRRWVGFRCSNNREEGPRAALCAPTGRSCDGGVGGLVLRGLVPGAWDRIRVAR